mmetsp:Transcript_10092/g.17029  ORF Transcript_10092/g.17029 Transcript_10092/m.17029 type:complete len:238 (-) Transcript_10092:223-936(-)
MLKLANGSNEGFGSQADSLARARTENYCLEAIQALSQSQNLKQSNAMLEVVGEGNVVDHEYLMTVIYPSLRSVVLAFSKYDPTITFGCGVELKQGRSEFDFPIEMGFRGLGSLLAQILIHTRVDEVSTFWILVSLVENYEMRQFYQQGMPGVTLLGEVFQTMIERHHPELADIFRRLTISYYDYFGVWAKSLFSMLVPFPLYSKFLDIFLREGWAYFFKVSMSVFSCLQLEIKTIDQ